MTQMRCDRFPAPAPRRPACRTSAGHRTTPRGHRGATRPWPRRGFRCPRRKGSSRSARRPCSRARTSSPRMVVGRDTGLGLSGSCACSQPSVTACPSRRGCTTGAGAEIRTRTPLRAAEFKSAASAVPPLRRRDTVAPGDPRERATTMACPVIDGPLAGIFPRPYPGLCQSQVVVAERVAVNGL